MTSSIFTPNCISSFPGDFKKVLASKIQQPKQLTGTSLISRKHMLLNNQAHRYQKLKAMESRVASKYYESIAHTFKVDDEMKDIISRIKSLLITIDDGRISPSAYDTAWVAMIRSIDGNDTPQFPSSVEWVVQHQLCDGSWGDDQFYSVYDRLLNTIACVMALKSWNIHNDKIEKGILYLKKHVAEIEDASDEDMTCGFEVIYPAILQRAHNMGIDDIPISQNILIARDQKLKKIPRELMHQVKTTLLYSLEGLEDLDWSRLLKLQSIDGSFFTSPSSTAFAFMETKDPKCLNFITNVVKKFNGGAPTTYPVDLFARLWTVDRLQLLGISRFFEAEIEDFLAYVYRYWNENGIYSVRDLNFSDIDDTCMALRLLRLQGYDINSNVLRTFKEGDRFFCHKGEVNPSTSTTYNLYRTSQIQFLAEDILEEAYNFSSNFLQEWLAGDQMLDKWIVSKTLPNEIRVALEMPWYATLPRVEAAYYLRHYEGSNNVWIAKNFYRMHDIDNDHYLELARLDFERCQSQHRIEWSYMQRWYEYGNFQEFGISRKDLLVAYFISASTIFEPEKVKERIVWAKSQLICRMVGTFYGEPMCTTQQKNVLLNDLRNKINGSNKFNSIETKHRTFDMLLEAISDLSEGFDDSTSLQLTKTWFMWLMRFGEREEEKLIWEDAELIVTTLNICSGNFMGNDNLAFHHEYITLSKLTNKICHHLSLIKDDKMEEMTTYRRGTWKCNINVIESDLKVLTKLVLEKSDLDKNIKQIFLWVAKTYYYSAFFDAEAIDQHIFKVLFEPLD